MRVFLIGGVLLLLALTGLYFGLEYLGVGTSNQLQEGQVISVGQADNREPTIASESSQPIDYQVQSVVQGLSVPWSLEWTSNDRMLVAERTGAIREVINGELQAEPLIEFDEVSTQSEEGLMGLTKDPAYDNTPHMYVCYAYAKDGGIVDKVVRFTDPSRAGDAPPGNPKILVDDIPAAQYHAGCRIKFGPDGYLYVTTGDATDKNIAQDLDSLGGKILRMNFNGSPLKDNPFYDTNRTSQVTDARNYIWSYGHRNPQGLAWTDYGFLWSSEHGPSVFDGPAGGDEINFIERGENYGWPLVSHDRNQEGLMAPKLTFTPAIAPGSAMIYSGDVFPQWKGDLFVGALAGEGVVRIDLNEMGNEILGYEQLDLKGVDPGRVRDVAEGPDGLIYFTSSNTDGRGTAREGDDQVWVIRGE